MQTKTKLSCDLKRYTYFNLAEIQFKTPNGEYSQNRLEYLNLTKESVLKNQNDFIKLFNEIIDMFNDKTDFFYYYLRGEILWWNGFYYLYELLNNIFKSRNIHHKLIFLDNNPNLKFKEDSNYSGWPYMLGRDDYGHTNNVIFENRQFNKQFLCLNRRPKEFREEIVKIILENKLENNFNYSFGVDGDSKNHPLYKKIDCIVSPGKIPITGLEQNSFCLLITENTIENIGRTWNDEVDEKIILRDDLMIHLTEKTTRALVFGMPFIMVGQTNSLKTLQEYGFKTFDKWWDESYDSIYDWNERKNKIKELMLEISNYSLDKCNKIYNQMIPILKHNRNRHLELSKIWNNDIKMSNVIDYKFENENYYYKFFEKLKFNN